MISCTGQSLFKRVVVTGAYFKPPEVYTNVQKHHGSKSSHTSDSQTLCPTFDTQTDWEHNLKTSSKKLNESQSSLTSRSSSLGNKTQSTNLSNENNMRSNGKRGSADRKSQKSLKHDGSLDRTSRKQMVVSSTGESKLSN